MSEIDLSFTERKRNAAEVQEVCESIPSAALSHRCLTITRRRLRGTIPHSATASAPLATRTRGIPLRAGSMGILRHWEAGIAACPAPSVRTKGGQPSASPARRSSPLPQRAEQGGRNSNRYERECCELFRHEPLPNGGAPLLLCSSSIPDFRRLTIDSPHMS